MVALIIIIMIAIALLEVAIFAIAALSDNNTVQWIAVAIGGVLLVIQLALNIWFWVSTLHILKGSLW